MTCLRLLPETIYPLIRNYLVSYWGEQNEDIKSWRNFLNSSKSLFHPSHSIVKSRYIYYNLSPTYSDAYIYYDSSRSEPSIYAAILLIRRLIQCPAEQIRLNLAEFDYLAFHQTFSFFFFRQSDARFEYVHCLDLSYQYKLTNISSVKGKVYSFVSENCEDLFDITALRGTPCVLLSSNSVNDVRPLQDSKIVSLEFLPGVRDVSWLRSLHTLVLHGCENVSDVSMLGGLKSLSIYSCPNVTDVSALGGVRMLVLRTTGVIVKFLPFDNQVEDLTCPTDYLTLINQFRNKQNKKLCLVDLLWEFSLLSLRGWKEIRLKDMRDEVIDSSFFQPKNDNDREMLKDPIFRKPPPIRRLNIIGASCLKTIHFLVCLYYLKLDSCHSLLEIDFRSFLKLKQCWIHDCSLEKVHVEGSLERLTISANLKDVEVNVFKGMKQLLVEKCEFDGKIRCLYETEEFENDLDYISLIGSERFTIE
eukprot:gene12215-13355_t